MTCLSDLKALLNRLLAAEGPDRRLAVFLWAVSRGYLIDLTNNRYGINPCYCIDHPNGALHWKPAAVSPYFSPPHYTAEVSTELPGDSSAWWRIEGYGNRWNVSRFHHGKDRPILVEVTAATEPLARRAATIAAMIEEMEG